MNEIKRINNIINNYKFPFDYNERKVISEIVGKVINIYYGKESLSLLEENDVSFLREKNFINDLEKVILISYRHYVSFGHSLDETAKEKTIKILEKIAKKYQELEELLQYSNACKFTLSNEDDLNDLNAEDIQGITNLIINSNLSDTDKEELLIYLSLNLNHYIK